ncbi:ssDNA-dependent ATPase MGS1 Ecym_6466 [Eremothecium cymbalariae DBVPG|uniref:UBZ4-type domain-containing protein n=1 Tax=Eremothecium cymbalariae (strain CBS 270.75 / DBVPG 7215 / KCTC 17166 / NRRL Y-17582) TaxID=931890 RepID=G8JUQ7_ERECY|nr:hypothetical protein Ecym_6466 [Eremothecium cymbalariae DBVPG\
MVCSQRQLILCPVCDKHILYSTINEHLDVCTNSGSKKDKGQQTTLPDIINFRKRKFDSTETVVVEDDADTKVPVSSRESVSAELSEVDHAIGNDNPPLIDPELKALRKVAHLPLSEKLRPKNLKEYIGQHHILSQENGILYKYISQGSLPSMILWGPPGVGKTSLAKLLTKTINEDFKSQSNYCLVETSATKINAQELRVIFENSKKEFHLTKRITVLFVDEIHRFNKGQQDLLLPTIETGTMVLVGATTENPSFQLNNALLSRCQVFVLRQLTAGEMQRVIARGIATLNKFRRLIWNIPTPLKLDQECISYINNVSIGDTRKALNVLEMIEISTRKLNSQESLGLKDLKNILHDKKSDLTTYYDAKGEKHYDTISAFHKSVRGSDENAALYYLARMLQGGEDPLFIARRMIRIASEDVGLVDNSLLPLAIAAHDAVMKIGLPEADLSLAHCAVVLARANKSVELYRGWNRVKEMVAQNKYRAASSEIPYHLRNAETQLMKDLGYSKGYKYNPEYKNGKVVQEYFPKELQEQCEDKSELLFLNGIHLGSRIDPDLEHDDVGHASEHVQDVQLKETHDRETSREG